MDRDKTNKDLVTYAFDVRLGSLRRCTLELFHDRVVQSFGISSPESICCGPLSLSQRPTWLDQQSCEACGTVVGALRRPLCPI
jgi:hypothetical protein